MCRAGKEDAVKRNRGKESSAEEMARTRGRRQKMQSAGGDGVARAGRRRGVTWGMTLEGKAETRSCLWCSRPLLKDR